MQQKDLYQQVILEHNRSPRNFGKLDPHTHFQEGRNPICGDHLNLTLIYEDELIKDIKFDGEGCAISKSSASLMTESIKGTSYQEVKKKIQLFRRLIMGKNLDETEILSIGKLKIFSGVSEYPGRVKCALLAWHTLEAALENDSLEGTTTTED